MKIKIDKVKLENGNSYDFNIIPEQSKEDIRDFHLFCLSIVLNLVHNKFKTNEFNEFTYDFSTIDSKHLEDTSFILHYIYNIIYKEKMDLDNQLDELLN